MLERAKRKGHGGRRAEAEGAVKETGVVVPARDAFVP